MLGIIQEQHPERCQLFMQWKQMDWPILIDPLNILQVQVVPITMAIDEHGVIRKLGLRLSEAASLEEDFLNRDFPPPENASFPKTAKPDLPQLRSAAESGSAATWRNYADALALWGGAEKLTTAVDAYEKALKLEAANGTAADEYTHYRAGVAYRMRYDSEFRQPGDFQRAAQHWQQALDINPNNYIIRRRIQQYGPRLAKPYPFYDWVLQAQQEIAARGGTPVPLRVQPGGAEFASPNRSFQSTSKPKTEPDPQGRIHRDESGFIDIETTVVPAHMQPGSAARVHVVMRPNEKIKAHWNNEVDDLALWITPPTGWQVDSRYQTVPNAPAAFSKETRTIEFEIKSPEDAKPGEVTFSGYALYYVCEDVDGTCLYRRQDVTFAVEVSR